MKTVILMRHAEARPEQPGSPDFDRRLSVAGEHMAHESAMQLRQTGVTVDRILTSSAFRTLQTAQAIAGTVCPDAPLLALDELYLAPAAAYSDAIRQITDLADQSVAVVGHNPGIAELMGQWMDRFLSIPPGTIAVFEIDTDDWRTITVPLKCPARLKAFIQDGQRHSGDGPERCR